MAKKKGCLGCSFPVAIGLLVVVLVVVISGMLAGPLGDALGIKGLPGWMGLADRPEFHLPAAAVFHIASFPVTNTLIATWITMAVLIILFAAAFSRSRLIPTRLQSVFESLLGFIYNLVVSIAGEKDGRRFFPLVATIFLFVGFNAWLALIPGYGSITYTTSHGAVELIRGANTDLNTTLALALITFCVTEFIGFKRLRFGYLKKFFVFGGLINSVKLLFKGKIGKAAMEFLSGFISFFTGIIELLGEFIRIVSLTFRLFGNMTAGEILLVSITYLLPFLVPIVFYGLEVLVGFIQALVFAGLTIVYISLAVASHSSEEHGH